MEVNEREALAKPMRSPEFRAFAMVPFIALFVALLITTSVLYRQHQLSGTYSVWSAPKLFTTVLKVE
jgi:hypothetical protein